MGMEWQKKKQHWFLQMTNVLGVISVSAYAVVRGRAYLMRRTAKTGLMWTGTNVLPAAPALMSASMVQGNTLPLRSAFLQI